MLRNKENCMRRFVCIMTAGLLAIALLSGCSDKEPRSNNEPQSQKEPQRDKASQSDKDKLQGTWQMVSAERMGGPLPGFKEQKILIEGDMLTFKQGDEVLFNGKIALDPSKQPKTLDMALTEDAQGHHQGEVSQGIYEVEGDTFKWCNASPGEPDRPKEFSTNKEENHMLLVLKRDKN
jgi:uncharacterized protein (TIGR03067 family)